MQGFGLTLNSHAIARGGQRNIYQAVSSMADVWHPIQTDSIVTPGGVIIANHKRAGKVKAGAVGA